MSNHRRARPAALALLLAPLGLTACDGGVSTDIPATLVFAERTDAEISRLLSAAGGTDMFSAQSQLEQLGNPSGFDPIDPCPAVAISGQTATITGGCTTAEGDEITGTASITNPIGWDTIEFQYGAPSVYTMEALTITRSGFTQSYDGVFTIDDFQAWDADLISTSFDVTVRTDLQIACSSSTCDIGGGVDLIGVGGAHVSGTVEVSQTGSQRYTLRGQDTLTAEITQGCVAWQISGSERSQVCAN